MKVDNDQSVRTLFLTASIVFGLFIIFQLFGAGFLPQAWSLTYSQVLPVWYKLVWVAFSALLIYLFVDFAKLEQYLKFRFSVFIGAIVILALMILFRYDSFLYGGGNLRVAQLSQVERIIPRWFEWGTTTMLSALYPVGKALDPRANWASIHAWQIFSFLSTTAALIASILSSRLLAKATVQRLMVFAILFFGGQTAAYFGFIGVEPIVTAVISWAFYFSIRLTQRHNALELLWLWVVCVLGVICHYSLLVLLPAAAYFTIAGAAKAKKGSSAAVVTSLIVYIGLIVMYYRHASGSLEFARGALLLYGKPPMTDYGVVSFLHITDWLQLVLLTSPMVIVTITMLFAQRSGKQGNALVYGWTIAAISGLTFTFISDPENSMALDLPRLVVYLAPVACVTALLSARLKWEDHLQRRLLGFISAAAIAVPMIFVPSLVKLDMADKFAAAFLPYRDIYYRTTCLAFRDVYWTNRQMENADRWEALLPVKSTDYMNMRGCSYLVASGDNDEALKRLYQTIARLPYWTEPRIIASKLLTKLRHFKEAKAQIDTCLMLEPDNRTHLTNLYAYYRDLPDYPNAIKTMDRLLYLYPADPEVKVDQMIVMLRSGQPQAADSIANYLLTEDSTRAYPYMIKGMIAERRSDTADAIRNYRTFLRFGSLQPDTSIVWGRLKALEPAKAQ